MKYSENLITRTIRALENHPTKTVWNVHKRTQYDTFCEIRFENVDGKQMSINIGESEISAIAYSKAATNGFKWFGDCHMKQNTADSYMMWLGITVEKMLAYFDN